MTGLPMTTSGGRTDAALREAEQFAAEWYGSPIAVCGRVRSVMTMTAKVVALLEKWDAARPVVTKPTERHGVAGGEAGLREALTNEAAFLLERLDEFESEVTEGQERDWIGHVAPSMARLAALTSIPRQPSPGASGEREALADEPVCYSCSKPIGDANYDIHRDAGFIHETCCGHSALAVSSPPAEMAGVEEIAWRPMDTAPHGKQIVARHKPNKHTPHGWIATIVSDFDDPDEHRRGGLDTILHYNGDTLQHGFHGCWTGWMWPEELAALRTRQDTRAGGAVEDDLTWLRTQVFALCEDTEDKCGTALEEPDLIDHARGFHKGRAYEAKGIRRAIAEVVRCRLTDRAAAPTAPTGTDDGEGA